MLRMNIFSQGVIKILGIVLHLYTFHSSGKQEGLEMGMRWKKRFPDLLGEDMEKKYYT